MTPKMYIFTTTLKAIRKHSPCEDGWQKLLAHLGKAEADDEPLNLLTILESNGVQDMMWALRCVDHPDRDRVARLMACDFAEAVLPLFEKDYPEDMRPRECIKVARMFARGEADNKQMAAARDAARDAAWDAAWDAAGAAARDAAWAAAWDAAGAAARDAAWAAARDAAWAAAWAAAGDAARDAAWDAAWAAARDAARDAAGDAAWDAAKKKQAAIIRKYLKEGTP